MDLARLMASQYGVARRTYLLDRGVDRAEIQRCLRGGTLRRLRRGWYATEIAHPAVVTAVRDGGVLGCVSALRLHDVWVPPFAGTHVRSWSGGCRQYGRPEPALRSVDDIPIALRHAVRCLDSEGIIVVCDSLLHLGLMTRADIEHELVAAPGRIRRLVARCDPAESGTDSIVRVRLRARGIRVRTQVRILGLGWVDLLVGRVIIEVDGAEYHISPKAFEEDRRRDRQAVRLGYIVVRLSYKQVMHEWEATEAVILELVRRREHLRFLPGDVRRSS